MASGSPISSPMASLHCSTVNGWQRPCSATSMRSAKSVEHVSCVAVSCVNVSWLNWINSRTGKRRTHGISTRSRHRLSRSTHPIALSPHRLNHGASIPAFTCRAQLPPEIVHIHIHNISPGIRGHLPNLAQQLTSAAALTAPHQQKFHQRKFLHRQLHQPTVSDNPAFHSVQLDIAMPQHRIRKLIPPPQQSPAARSQLMETERLQQTIICPQIQTPYPLLYLTPSRQHQHRCLIEPPPQLRQHLGPVLSWQTQIENNQIRAVFNSMHKRRLAIPHPKNIMALQLQSLLQK
jgi:hypothetical protein